MISRVSIEVYGTPNYYATFPIAKNLMIELETE